MDLVITQFDDHLKNIKIHLFRNCVSKIMFIAFTFELMLFEMV